MFGIWVFWKIELSGFAGGVDGSGEREGYREDPKIFSLNNSRRAAIY